MSEDNPMNRKYLSATYYNAELGPVVRTIADCEGDYVRCSDVVEYIKLMSELYYSTDVLDMVVRDLS